MSGFLHRLAAQAIGKTNSLRSISRQLYAAAPALETAPVELDRQAAALAATDHQQHNVAGSDAGLNYGPGQQSRRDYPQTEQSARSREQEIAASPPEALVAQSSHESAARPLRHNEESQAAQAILRQSDVAITTSQQPAELVEGIDAYISMSNSATSSVADDKKNSAFTERGFPELLLPENNSARHSILNASAATQRGDPIGAAKQGQIEETTEVHVSIGRIEVTAVHEAPATKRQAQPAPPKAVSLDEYLARRGRGT